MKVGTSLKMSMRKIVRYPFTPFPRPWTRLQYHKPVLGISAINSHLVTDANIARISAGLALVILTLPVVPLVTATIPNLQWKFQTSGEVSSVAVSSDGSYIAVGSERAVGAHPALKSGSIYLLNRAGAIMWQRDIDRAIHSVLISSDGSYVVAAGYQLAALGLGYGSAPENGTIYFLDRNGTLLWSYASSSPVVSLAISSDASDVAAAVKDAILFFNRQGDLLWKKVTGSIGSRLSYFVTSVAISAGGSYVTAGVEGQSTRLVDGVTAVEIESTNVYLLNSQGEIIWNKTVGGFVNKAEISADGKYVAASWGRPRGIGDLFYVPGDFTSLQQSTVDFFDRGGNLLWHLDFFPDVICSISMSASGSYIAVSSDSASGLLFLNSDKRILWNSTRTASVQLTPDGSYLLEVAGHQCSSAAYTGRGYVSLLSHYGTLIWNYSLSDAAQITADISPDATSLAVGVRPARSTGLAYAAGWVYFFSTDEPEVVRTFTLNSISTLTSIPPTAIPIDTVGTYSNDARFEFLPFAVVVVLALALFLLIRKSVDRARHL